MHPVGVGTEQHVVLVLFVVVTVAGSEQHGVALDHLPHGRVEEVLGVEQLGTGALPDARQKVGPIDGDHRLRLEATDAVLGDDAGAEAERRSRRAVVLVPLVALDDAQEVVDDVHLVVDAGHDDGLRLRRVEHVRRGVYSRVPVALAAPRWLQEQLLRAPAEREQERETDGQEERRRGVSAARVHLRLPRSLCGRRSDGVVAGGRQPTPVSAPSDATRRDGLTRSLAYSRCLCCCYCCCCCGAVSETATSTEPFLLLRLARRQRRRRQ